MKDSVKQLQLAGLSALAALATLGSLIYIGVTQPESLQQSREGVPFFTPPVVNPDGGEPLSVDALVEHYKRSMQ